jgi:hypothetical protein
MRATLQLPPNSSNADLYAALPLDEGMELVRVVGLYIATLFVVWQVINFIAFRTLPTLPIVVGGL